MYYSYIEKGKGIFSLKSQKWLHHQHKLDNGVIGESLQLFKLCVYNFWHSAMNSPRVVRTE
jgi:hypothetical protein